MADITCKDNKNLQLKIGLILIYLTVLTVIYIYMHC